MKKQYLIFLLSVLSFAADAQIVTIPDANFKAFLLNHMPPIDTNGDNQIQTSEALAVTQLFATSENIADLTGIQAFTNLTFLNLVDNDLTTIDVTGLVNLTGLNVDSNQLTSINLGNVNNLATLSLNDNNLASLDISGKTIDWLSCAGNQMTSLNLANTEIQELRCEFNSLPALDLTDINNLQELYCTNNQLTELDFSSNPMLYRVECDANPITSLDFSKNRFLFEVVIFNPQLQYINFKNGGDPIYLSFEGILDGFLSVCADDDDIDYWQNYFAMFSVTNIYVSSYCSFVPGGTYNTITGSVKHDLESDGCDATEPLMPHLRVNINDGVSSGAVFTTNDGFYNLYPNTGTFTVTPVLNFDYFTVNPPSALINFADNNSNITPQDFCMVRNGIHKDLEVTIVPGIPARPGFDATYMIIYKNKGTETMSGYVNLTFQDNLMDFVSATPTVDVQSENNLNWNYTNLQPFESREIFVTVNINAPTDTPPVNIGMQLNFTATVFPVADDETMQDNTFGIKQIVVGSFDPNDITCLQGETITPEQVGEFLHYHIRFQNSGTFYAENVVVTDVIDETKYDLSTFELISTSHQAVTRITGNKLEFIFEGIQLPAEQVDEPGSHGYVTFKIRSKDNLVVGNSVSQFADIFFDFNLPITTNTAVTTVALLSTENFGLASLSVYPNPARSEVNVSSAEAIEFIDLYDIQGRRLMTFYTESDHATIDMDKQISGIYFLKVSGKDASSTVKIVKE